MKKIENYKLNKDNIIIAPQFHDSLLKKIEILDKNKFNIIIQIKTQLYKIVFSEIEYLVVNDFKMGNIILDIEVFKKCNCSLDFLNEILKLNRDEYYQYLTKIANDIELGNLMLVIINPSYGAEIT